jgi:anti-sigma regulatory factor (Ser/Thr protein kinase)
VRVVSQIEQELWRAAVTERGFRYGHAEHRPLPRAAAGHRACPADALAEAGVGPWNRVTPSSSGASTWPLQSYLELGALPGAVPCARLHARHVLWEWNLKGLGESAELVVSELVTNAIQASRTAGRHLPVRLRLLSDQARVVIHVWDSSPDPPQPAQAGDTDESGRGLLLVEAMSTAWDWYSHDGGKVVRATLEAES